MVMAGSPGERLSMAVTLPTPVPDLVAARVDLVVEISSAAPRPLSTPGLRRVNPPPDAGRLRAH
jgi:hypothetical protein